jgi:hypothetical protein
MALTSATYSATAGQTDFAITFPYIETTHVYVKIDGEDTAAFTVNTGTGNVVLNTGATAGQTVKVYRKTPGRTEAEAVRLVDFQDGSVLTEADLDKITLQLLYLSQEAQETGSDSLPIDFDGNYNAGGRRIKNMGTPSLEADSVTKGYVDGLTIYGAGAAIPQSWSFEANDLTGLTGTVSVELDSPTPAASNTDLYIVSLDGYIQRPGTDFVVSESGGVYTLTFYLGATVLSGPEPISVQNFGVARSTVSPDGVIMPDADTPALTAIADPSPNVPILVVEQSDGTDVLTIDNDGDLVVTGDITGGGSLTVPGGITAASCDTTGVVNGSQSNIPKFTANAVRFDNSIDIYESLRLRDDNAEHYWGSVGDKPLRMVRGVYIRGAPGALVAGLGSLDPYYLGWVKISTGGEPVTTVHPWSELDTSIIKTIGNEHALYKIEWSAQVFFDSVLANAVYGVAAVPIRYDGSALGTSSYPNGKTIDLVTNPDLEMRQDDYYAGINSKDINRVRCVFKNEGSSTASSPFVPLHGSMYTTRNAVTANDYIGLGFWLTNSNQTSVEVRNVTYSLTVMG